MWVNRFMYCAYDMVRVCRFIRVHMCMHVWVDVWVGA